ncbi:MAG: sodium ion-translocating decarboxylase subunit beta [Lachnospiraceae bacterium]|nr:sodium ion-translocating decarboxylase subunit beta [Lachnospiraceae bacterium]
MNNVSVIGGADGPTTIFLAGSFGWLNLFGLILVALLLVPNIIYALKVKERQNKCQNKLMNALERIGCCGCMFLMVFNIGIAKFAFRSVEEFLIYLFGNILLVAACWVVWGLYFHKPVYWKQMALAILQTLLFLLSGLTMRHWLLVIFAAVFAAGRIYVMNENRVS